MLPPEYLLPLTIHNPPALPASTPAPAPVSPTIPYATPTITPAPQTPDASQVIVSLLLHLHISSLQRNIDQTRFQHDRAVADNLPDTTIQHYASHLASMETDYASISAAVPLLLPSPPSSPAISGPSLPVGTPPAATTITPYQSSLPQIAPPPMIQPLASIPGITLTEPHLDAGLVLTPPNAPLPLEAPDTTLAFPDPLLPSDGDHT
jgi:hypothetical protein